MTFADAAGLTLSKVRVIHESSDDPPALDSLIAQKPAHADEQGNRSAAHLVVKFSQPAASYMAFRQKVMTDCVSLENVIVRDNFKLVGTVKAKNVACSKAVTLRYTVNSWSSFEDVAAKSVNSEASTFGLFVTFTFEVDIPSNVSTAPGAVQFAVCYVADGQEYWDNNNGQNYVIDVQSESSPEKRGLYAAGANSQAWVGRNATGVSMPRESVYSFEPSTSWSEFAGWSDLVSESPYW